MARENMSLSFTGRSCEEQRKSCTDLACCGFFIICLLGLLAMAGLGFKDGNPATLELLIRGKDFTGRLCGKDKDVKDFPLAYYTLEDKMAKPKEWTKGLRTRLKLVCTNTCPTKDSALNSTVTRKPGLCPGDMYQQNMCTWYGAATLRFADYCLDPDVFVDIVPNWEQSIEDLKSAAYHLIAIFPVSIIIGLIYLATMEKCGGVFVWCTIILVVLLPAGIGYWLFRDATEGGQAQDLANIKPEHEKWMAYGCWIFSGAIVLMVCCSLKTVNGVAAVVSGTSQFLQDVPSQFVQPLIFGLIHLVVMSAWLVILFFVMSIGAKEGNTENCLADQEFACIEWNRTTSTMSLIFLVLMAYWILNFLHACSHFGTAFAVREWWFSTPDETGARRPELGGHSLCDCKLSITGVCTGLRHHSGSFAFGGFCISICKVIQLLLCWLKKDEESHSNNAVLKCVLSCANCIAECVKRFVEFVSEHAYVEMALQGNGFCHSAKEALKLTIDEPGMFALVDRVACMVRILGVALITIAGAFVVRLSLEWWKPAGLMHFQTPTVVAAFFSLFIGEIMMHPFSASARACLHCYVMEKHNPTAVAGMCNTPQPFQRLVESHGHADVEPRRGCCC